MQTFSPRSLQLVDRRLIVALALIAGCWFEGFFVAARAQSAPTADELLRCPNVEEEFTCVKVTIFDEETQFVIDTGASITTLDTRFQNRLGKRLDDAKLFQTPIGAIAVPYFRSPAMKIVTGDSDIGVSVPFVGTADLRSIRAGTDQPIAGVIGMDFLKNYVLRMNFDEGYAALVLAPRDTPAEIKLINFDKFGIPSIRLRISDDQFHEVNLDTGSCNSDLLLEQVLFRKLTKKGRVVVDGGLVVAAAGGFAGAQTGTLDQAELESIRLRNVDVSSNQMNQIGLKFLERFETEFDFPNRKAYFRRGKRFYNPPRKNLSHFSVKIVDDNLVVVVSRGTAQDAGIRVDDVLVAVNDRPAREMTISGFRSLQCRPDTELNLRFERHRESFEVSLKLKQPPAPFPDNAPEGPDEPPNR